MTARVVTVEMDDRLDVVKQIFDTLKFHHLLGVDDRKKLVGIVSDRDLLKALSPYVGSAAETTRDIATLNKRVHQIMSRNPFTLHPGAKTADCVQLFLAQRISCIPIVDGEFKPGRGQLARPDEISACRQPGWLSDGRARAREPSTAHINRS